MAIDPTANGKMSFDVSWMVGRAISEVIFSAPESWRFRFGDAAEICTTSLWRVIVSGHIALSSADHGHQFGLPSPVDAEASCRSLVCGLAIQNAEVRDDTRDIVIVFESGGRLEIVPISSGYESWEVVAPDGSQTIAQGGGNLVVF